MISLLNEETKLSTLRQLIDGARKIAVLVHMSPDGDALGSATAFRAVMSRLEKEVQIISPDMMLASLKSLPGADTLIDATNSPDKASNCISEADLIVCLDFNELKRIGRVAKYVEEANVPKVMIDHHLHPQYFADLTISYPEMSSTSFLLFKVLCGMGMFDLIDKTAATCILTGMMTDTGNFSYNASDPDLYIVVADLMRKGADKEAIYRSQFETHSLSSMKLNAYAIAEKLMVWEDMGAALITLTRAELNKYNYVKGDTEGLVNRPLAIPGVKYCAFMREEDGYVKVSMRSLDDVPVNEMCKQHFGGGGHLNAAGGEFEGTLQQATDLFISLLETNKALYIK